MAEPKTPILRYMVADYLEVSGAYVLMSVYNSIDENPTAQTKETQYTADKSKTVITTGYATVFPITGDMYSHELTSEYLVSIGEEQKLGADAQTNYVRVRLYQPTVPLGTTYYARLFKVGVEISGITGAGGENMVIEGNLNAMGDATIGTFDTSTLSFTAK